MASKPELDRGGIELARAYAQMSTCRAIGMGGIGPIPINVVWGWEDRNGVVDPELRRFFEDVFTHIDSATLRRANRPPAAGAENKKP